MAASPHTTTGGAAAPALRVLLAGNPSALTLDGTRTYIVGRRRAAVIDPGPADDAHIQAIQDALGKAEVTAILLTHRHPDHAAAAPRLARLRSAPVRALADRTLAPGDAVETDAGPLVAVATPGHTGDHVAFHWPARAALFCGDLMLGGQDTALVAPPEGDLGAYLDSLRRIAALEPRTIHPAHGAPFTDPAAAIARYIDHRTEREEQVLDALARGASDSRSLVDRVYGTGLAAPLRRAAEGAIAAYLEHLRAGGRVRRDGGRWSRT